MALTLTELQAITDAYVESVDNDIYFRANVLLWKLMGGNKGGKTIPGGKTIDVVVEWDEGNSGSYGNTTNIALAKKEVFNKASFPWSAYYSSLTIDLDDARQNNGDLAIVNLIQGKLKNAQKSIRNRMGSAVYASQGADTNALLGLGDLFQDSDTTLKYGGIAEDDMVSTDGTKPWRANTIGTSTVISFAALQEIRRAARVDDNAEGIPDLYITTETLLDKFESTLQTQARYSDAKLVDAGFNQNVLFGGAPIVVDNKQTANYVDALNTRHLDLYTHTDFNFTKPVWAAKLENSDTKVAAIKWSGQLVTRHRAAHCRHTNMQVA